ncbi:MAG: hypothetical protein JRG82_09180 [Deltaproteobacteria bacterium]|nr:hypothetical protein [Deltaproteobacteria bacterium]
MAHYDDALTLGEARSRYFEANGFETDGGYSARWVQLRAGPLRFGFPNTASRVRAVRLHDLHHLLTGYETDWKGEFEISAWEIASSCRDYGAAWVLNIGGLAAGLFTHPRAVWHAFVRGRHSGNFYATGYSEALLELTVGDARRDLGLEDEPPPTLADRATFGAWSAVALAYGAVPWVILGALLLYLRS